MMKISVVTIVAMCVFSVVADAQKLAKVHSDQHVWLKVDKTGKFVE